MVRGRLRVERRALAHAEAVLLVDDGDRERREAHVGLDQRVRADDQLQLAAAELADHVGAPRGGRRAGQQRGRHGLARHQRLDRREVLLGQHLGRRHQRRLVAVLDGAQHRCQRDDRLARADLAHQQPLHRAGLREVGEDARRSPASGRRSARTGGSRRASAARARRRRPSSATRGDGVAAVQAAAQQVELDQQQLLERQPAAAPLEVAGVRGDQRAPAGRAACGARACGRAAARSPRARPAGARAPARGSASTTAPRSPGSARPRRRRRRPPIVVACEVTLKRLRAS